MQTREIAYFHEDTRKSNKTAFHRSKMQNTVEASFTIGKSNEMVRLNSETITEDNNSLIDADLELRKKSENQLPKDFAELVNTTNNFNTGEIDSLLLADRFNKQLVSEGHNHSQGIKFNNGRWSTEEHQKFIEAIFLYGNEWKKVQQHIKTRSSTQARSHAQKFFIRLRKNFLSDEEDIEKTNLILARSANLSRNDSNGTVSAKRNEKILNWIKENLNSDVILKLLQNSGNDLGEDNFNFINKDEKVFNDAISYSSGCRYLGYSPKLSDPGNFVIPNFNFPSNFNSENSNSTNFKNNLNAFNNKNDTYRHISKEDFITEGKEKLCKIILDLISNPSRIKKNSLKQATNSNVIKKENISLIEKTPQFKEMYRSSLNSNLSNQDMHNSCNSYNSYSHNVAMNTAFNNLHSKLANNLNINSNRIPPSNSY